MLSSLNRKHVLEYMTKSEVQCTVVTEIIFRTYSVKENKTLFQYFNKEIRLCVCRMALDHKYVK